MASSQMPEFLEALEASKRDPEERFLNFFKTDKYRQEISKITLQNHATLTVDFDDLLEKDVELAQKIIEEPDEYLEYANRAAKAQLQIEEPLDAEKFKEVTVQFRGLPETTPLRNLKSTHLGKLIQLNGIVVRAQIIKPRIMNAFFKCKWCGAAQSIPQSGLFLAEPEACIDPVCRRKGSFLFLQKESSFTDSQNIHIQEPPEELPPGQLPRWISIRLLGPLVNTANPGDFVSVVGITRASSPTTKKGEGKLRDFNLSFDTNYLEVTSKELGALSISAEEEEEIVALSKDYQVHRNIIQSIAPSIYGYEHIKEAIMYQLFGGVPKNLQDIRIRGDIHILVIGDPATAKSQLLQYVTRIAPRALYASGRGTTGAGLTAAVLSTKEGMTLEAGALVLADTGVCCIDELDKVQPKDRDAIHTAMEQQIVSIAKGGIVATLNAKTSILAAANPTLGRYDPYCTMAENIPLGAAILSRFDLIFVLKDAPEKEADTRMAEHMLDLHNTETPMAPIPSTLLRKYIGYAKNIKPVLSKEAKRLLLDFYVEMRTQSADGDEADMPIAMTPRQLEALTRLSEARARVSLRPEVLAEDAEAAIAIMTKSLNEVGIDLTSKKYDIDIIMTGIPKTLKNKLRTVLDTLTEINENGVTKKTDLIGKLASEYGIPAFESEKLISQLHRDGDIFCPMPGYIKKA